MAVKFFYISIAVTWLIFLVCAVKKKLALKHILIGITAMGYSLLYETVLGEYTGLYYYINKENSLLYIILSAVLLYSEIEVIYTLFLPENISAAVYYTVAWIALMLVFELASFYTGTVVLTGWKVVPWSIVTYLFTFLWINLLFRLLNKRGL